MPSAAPTGSMTLHNILAWMAASRMQILAAPATLRGLPGRSANVLRLLDTAMEAPARLRPQSRRPLPQSRRSLPLLLRLQATRQAKLPSPYGLCLSLLLLAQKAAKQHSLPAEQMQQLQAARLQAWLVAMQVSLSSPRRSGGRQHRTWQLMLQSGRHPLLLLSQLRSRVGSTRAAPARDLKRRSRGLWQEHPVSVPCRHQRSRMGVKRSIEIPLLKRKRRNTKRQPRSMASPPQCRVSGLLYLRAAAALALALLLAMDPWCGHLMQAGLLHSLLQFLRKRGRRPSRTKKCGQACCTQNEYMSGLSS